MVFIQVPICRFCTARLKSPHINNAGIAVGKGRVADGKREAADIALHHLPKLVTYYIGRLTF